MKKIIFIIGLLILFFSCSNSDDNPDSNHALNTAIPDAKFEQALINLGIDSDKIINQSVLFADISGITSLEISFKGIEDLTGIEDFISLTSLNCSFNQLSSLDVSNNSALNELHCSSNQLSSLDVGSNTQLLVLDCGFNLLSSLDVSQNTALQNLYCSNNQLSSLDVSQNTVLIEIVCYSNQFTSLDVSSNTVLQTVYCSENQLISLNVKNGNNSKITYFNATNNPSLTCIQVDVANTTAANWTNIDTGTTFSEDCGC